MLLALFLVICYFGKWISVSLHVYIHTYIRTYYSYTQYYIPFCNHAIGDTQAKVTINVPGTIPSGQPTSGSCVVSGNMYSRRPPYFFIRVKLVGNNNEADCSIECIGRFHELGRAHYRQNFNITCNHGNSVGIQCFTHINNEITKVSVQGRFINMSYS